jgi:hypothetical protein
MKKEICNWKFTDEAETFEIGGWHPNKKGLLIDKPIFKRGITPFGPQGGVLTEDKLTDAMVEWLMAKKTASGVSYDIYFRRKTNAEIEEEKRSLSSEQVSLSADSDSTGELEEGEELDTETTETTIEPDKGGKKGSKRK